MTEGYQWFPGVRRRVLGKGKQEREIRKRHEEFLLMMEMIILLIVMIFYSGIHMSKFITL